MSIDLFSTDFSRISGADLYGAIVEFARIDLPPDDRTPEGYTVDFKEMWNEKSLRVVAGFANTFGGILIVGVSEEKGKAKEIVGEVSNSELKTRFAGSIAANITPTPSYDIAECELPAAKGRRLCVIRVRPADRIHFLTTKGGTPVYVRNEDQAIPAAAAELRSLIARERDSAISSTASKETSAHVFELMPIYKPRPNNPALSAAQEYINADSVLKVSIVPEQRQRFSLDYNVEQTFRDAVARTFPVDSFAEDQSWDSDELSERTKSFYRIDSVHLGRGIESKWLLTNTMDFGYATLFSLNVPPLQDRIWSLPDFAAEVIASIRTAHFMLKHIGYLGEALIEIAVNPGAGANKLYIERSMLPFVRHSSIKSNPWPIVTPELATKQANNQVVASVSSNFHTRTEDIGTLVADLLNQILRDFHYGVDLDGLRDQITKLAKVLPPSL